MAVVHRPTGALASMIVPLEVPPEVPLEAPLPDPEVAPLDVAPESVPDPLDAPLPVPEPAPLPDPDADPELPLAPARFPLLPPLVPPLLADPEEPPSSDVAPCPDELEPLPHPAPTAQAKAASESDATKVDRRMNILLNPWEAGSARDRLKYLFEARSQLIFSPCDVRARGAGCPQHATRSWLRRN